MTKLENVVNYIKHIHSLNKAPYYQWDDLWNGRTFDAGNLEEYAYEVKDIIKVVDEVGGEGEGEYCHTVFSINHPKYGEVFIKCTGSYDSWNGSDYSYGTTTLCEHQEVKVWKYIDLNSIEDEEIVYALPEKYLDFSSNTIRDWLKGILRESIVILEFTKVSGEARVMKCTLKDELIPKNENESNTKTKVKKEADTAFRVYDLDQNDWRSIRWAFIKKIHIEV